MPTNADICVCIFGDAIVCRFSDQQQVTGLLTLTDVLQRLLPAAGAAA
ncbi:hypothetical protein R1X32_10920 (plasmid) [Rhodococcus opacus]